MARGSNVGVEAWGMHARLTCILYTSAGNTDVAEDVLAERYKKHCTLLGRSGASDRADAFFCGTIPA